MFSTVSLRFITNISFFGIGKKNSKTLKDASLEILHLTSTKLEFKNYKY